MAFTTSPAPRRQTARWPPTRLVVCSPVNQPTGSPATGERSVLTEFVERPAGGLCRTVEFVGDVTGRDHRSLDGLEDSEDTVRCHCRDELAAFCSFAVHTWVL